VKFDLFALLVTGGSAAIATWGIVAILIRLAPRLGLIDRPNERSLHTRATPRGGGIGFVLVMALAPGLLLAFGNRPHLPLLMCLGAALLVAAVSLRDDFKSLSPGPRFLCQVALAGAATLGAGYFRRVSFPGLGAIDLGWLGAAGTVLWIVGLTNVYNFMDGIDGIAGVQGLVAGAAWTAAGWWLGAPTIGLLGALVTGGCIGFLLHNWSPAKIFMGDVGSAFLGYLFAVLPLLALREPSVAGRFRGAEALPLFALLVVWPFVADGFYTFVRRAWSGEVVWKPHRSHLYQRLVRSGWTHAQVSTLYAVWCGGCALVAMGWLTGVPGAVAAVAVIPLFSLAGMIVLVKLRERTLIQKQV
jgi:UDP-N-acetylmuramyl pentapeptide phosphotransferase/UDP-N-acetylglucosamine-1-phosphate transferase